MRDDEVWAGEVLDKYLARNCSEPREWLPGMEPPDHLLRLGLTIYAVEVTQVQEEFRLGGSLMPERGLRESLLRVLGEMERTARDRGLLVGTYYVNMNPLPGLRAIRDELEAELFAYLERTRGLEKSDRTRLWGRAWGRQWHIAKISRDGNALLPGVALHGMALMQGEWREKLRLLLRDTLSSKRDKLVAVPYPTILLLIDAFHYAEPHEWDQLIDRELAASFCAVARLYHREGCQILWSTDPVFSRAA